MAFGIHTVRDLQIGSGLFEGLWVCQIFSGCNGAEVHGPVRALSAIILRVAVLMGQAFRQLTVFIPCHLLCGIRNICLIKQRLIVKKHPAAAVNGQSVEGVAVGDNGQSGILNGSKVNTACGSIGREVFQRAYGLVIVDVSGNSAPEYVYILGTAAEQNLHLVVIVVVCYDMLDDFHTRFYFLVGFDFLIQGGLKVGRDIYVDCGVCGFFRSFRRRLSFLCRCVSLVLRSVLCAAAGYSKQYG